MDTAHNTTIAISINPGTEPFQPVLGAFVVLKNGLMGPIVELNPDDDYADFHFAPLNEIPEDEHPAFVRDVAWAAPAYVKVNVQFDEGGTAEADSITRNAPLSNPDTEEGF